MAVVCRNCLIAKGLTPPAVRTGSGPCAFCGDEGLRSAKTGKPVKVNNYTYPDNLLPGTRAYEEMAGAEAGSGNIGGGVTAPAQKGT